jgi:ATP-dependent protease ClpP protease subunit
MRNTPPMRCAIRAEGGTTRVDVFDEIGDSGWGYGLSAKDFAAQLAGIKGPLDVHINSAGGDVAEGVAIGNTIRAYKGFKRTVVDGMAASIASVIAQAGDERVVEPGAMTFVHDAWGGCIGNAADMQKTAADLDKHSDNLAEIYAARAGNTKQHWRDVMQAETWFTADESVAAGLADRKGTGQAYLAPGTDLAAFTSIPDRIAAQLRTLPVRPPEGPQDASRHDPMKGTHSHPHPAYGSQGSDAMHSHEHQHDGDANHSHSHAEPDGGDGAQDSATGQDCPTCKGTGKIDEGHRQCPDCDGTGKKAPAAALTVEINGSSVALDEAFWAWLKESIRVKDAAGKPGTHGDHERFDPDGDGDCDACPEGDTDHDYWTAAGEQLKDVPGKPMEDRAELLAGIRAVVREELAGLATFLGADSKVDNSPWDASKAWSAGAGSDDPAAFYAGICAGQKAGDKSTQAAWALPYKYTPSSAPNAAGVRNALARLDQTEGLTNKAEAKATLQAAMKKVNPDWEPEDSADAAPEGHGRRKLSGAHLEQIRAALKGAKL